MLTMSTSTVDQYRGHTYGLSPLHVVLQAVADEQRLLGKHTKPLQCEPKDLGMGLRVTDDTGNDDSLKESSEASVPQGGLQRGRPVRYDTHGNPLPPKLSKNALCFRKHLPPIGEEVFLD